MWKYETTIHIVTEGTDRFEAGERAGELIHVAKMLSNELIWCEPTRSVIDRRVGSGQSQLTGSIA
jgi:hypothetical protein